MEYRQLGASGLQVSAVGLGANNFGGRLDSRKTEAVVHTALDAGVNLIDTSNSYGNGHSEEFIGRALRSRRQQAVIATKVSSRVADGPNNAGNSRKHILDQVETSLRKLGTDYIDLYQIHWWDPNTPMEETLRTLDDLIRQGKVRYAGCSNFAAWQVCEAHWTARSLGISGFASVQPRYSIMHRLPEKELAPVLLEIWGRNTALLPAGERLPYREVSEKSAGPRGHTSWRRGTEECSPTGTSTCWRGWNTLRRSVGHSVLELAFAWLLAKPEVSSAIAGATRPDQVAANAKSAGWALTSEDVEAAEAIVTAP